MQFTASNGYVVSENGIRKQLNLIVNRLEKKVILKFIIGGKSF